MNQARRAPFGRIPIAFRPRDCRPPPPVITARDGRDALDLFRSDRTISFVVLDLTRPRVDGEQCFRELRKIDPGAKVFLSSGYSEVEVSQKFADRGLAGFIQKPYRLAGLQEAITRAGQALW